VARTYVAVDADGQVVGYYTLVAGQVDHADASTSVRSGVSRHFPIPIGLIARLAVASSYQREGLGADLTRDAFRRILSASEKVGIRAVLVHAIDEPAAAFYPDSASSRPHRPVSRCCCHCRGSRKPQTRAVTVRSAARRSDRDCWIPATREMRPTSTGVFASERIRPHPSAGGGTRRRRRARNRLLGHCRACVNPRPCTPEMGSQRPGPATRTVATTSSRCTSRPAHRFTITPIAPLLPNRRLTRRPREPPKDESDLRARSSNQQSQRCPRHAVARALTRHASSASIRTPGILGGAADVRDDAQRRPVRRPETLSLKG
jgi:hypothetical protein